jgi:4-hydroxybenzoate polyprenyltransferase/phosphoserine phosphatase
MKKVDQAAPPTASPASPPALFVDLDGTLLKTDLLHEALLSALKNDPRRLVSAALALAGGRAAFKRILFDTAPPDIRLLPWREEVLELIAEHRTAGCKVVLATASDSQWVGTIAGELGLFDDVLCSDGVRNLKGDEKLSAIQEYCGQQGQKEFDYVGDSVDDLPILRAARLAYVVAPGRRLKAQMRAFAQEDQILVDRAIEPGEVLRALRTHQWVKNLLVFVPLITSHRLLEFALAAPAALAFVCFCACASAVYVLNDLFDLDADRRHPTKRGRGFASGALPIRIGPLLVIGLLIGGLLPALLFLPTAFSLALALYASVACAYSLWLKRVVMLDAIVLAMLYSIRVFAGGLATGIPVSEWLMAFSLFIFVSLAFAKRYVELGRLGTSNGNAAPGRGYRVDDLSLIESMGPAAGYMAVLILALYIQSQQVLRLYQQPWTLWLLCPLLLYWISRLWVKAKRRELADDPVVFAIRDPVSLVIAGMALALLIIAAVKG